jgi:hypothetical protein
MSRGLRRQRVLQGAQNQPVNAVPFVAGRTRAKDFQSRNVDPGQQRERRRVASPAHGDDPSERDRDGMTQWAPDPVATGAADGTGPDQSRAAGIGQSNTPPEIGEQARRRRIRATAPPLHGPPPDPFAGLERLGSLVVLGVDSTGKRTLTRCNCGAVREISTESIRTGERRSCGACGGRGRS